MTEVPNDPHWQIVCNLHGSRFIDYHAAHPGVILADRWRRRMPPLAPGHDLGTQPRRRRRPAEHAQGRAGPPAPALAVEVVSEGSEARDYETKRQEYLVYGLREYWIVDPQTRRVTVLSRDGDVWVERVFQGDQTIESRVLPGFEGRVADLWLDAETEADPDENA